MLIVLTDILSCPRCGPEFGLVVLADRLEHRRVLAGALGCANCRELYPIVDGLADLRYPPGARPADGPERASAPAADPHADAFRLAALLGVTDGPGVVLVAGSRAALAGAIPAIVPEIGAVAVGMDLEGVPEREGASRLLGGERLPLRSTSVRGAALTGPAADTLLEEGVRVLGRGARIVLDPAPTSAVARLEAAGLEVLLAQDDVVVAWRSDPR